MYEAYQLNFYWDVAIASHSLRANNPTHCWNDCRVTQSKQRFEKAEKREGWPKHETKGNKTAIIDAIIDTRSALWKGGGHFLRPKNATVLIYR